MKHCQSCKAEWSVEAPYCTECGFYAFAYTGESAQVRVINRTRQMAEIERERDLAMKQLNKAKELIVKLLTGYETVHSGSDSWTDSNFEVNLSDTHSFLRELERSS